MRGCYSRGVTGAAKKVLEEAMKLTPEERDEIARQLRRKRTPKYFSAEDLLKLKGIIRSRRRRDALEDEKALYDGD